MSKRTVFTTITPLPPQITRASVMETLHCHTEMIDLNPLVEERHPIKAPAKATPEEFHCTWYQITDKVQYLPGGLYSSKVTYTGCFHDLAMGLQTHVHAPMGLDIRAKWSLGGSLPGELQAPVEIGMGAPMTGLYLREDVDMRCNILMTNFVKKTLQTAHSKLVARLMVKTQLLAQLMGKTQMLEGANGNDRTSEMSGNSNRSSPHLSHAYSGSMNSLGSPAFPSQGISGFPAKSSPEFPPQSKHLESLQNQGFRSGQPSYEKDSRYQQQDPRFDPMYQESFAPSELSGRNGAGREKKHGGPPVHQVFAPVELPAHVPR